MKQGKDGRAEWKSRAYGNRDGIFFKVGAEVHDPMKNDVGRVISNDTAKVGADILE